MNRKLRPVGAVRPRRTGRRVRTAVLTTALVSGLALSVPALAADRESATDAEIQAALQRDLGLTAQQVREQSALQAQAIKRDRELQASLGSAYAGSRFDARTGKLITMVSDATQLDKVRSFGAEAKLVKHSKARLEGIRATFDAAIGKATGRASAARASAPVVDGMLSWYVDTATNTVRVTVKKGRAKVVATALARYGDAVTIAQTDAVPTATANFMDGGDLINFGSCSAGFNLRNPSTGQGYLLTAGHCVSTGSTLFGQGNVPFGRVLESWSSGRDDAIARNDNPGYWLQGRWVDVNPSNGGFVTVSGWADPPLFTWMCKSGITTRWTCGMVVGKNETVNLSGQWYYNLTRHTACSEPGDSGGANVSTSGGYRAIGVSSGAMLVTDIFSGGRQRCLGTFGLPNVSWHYPISQSMAHYGPRYGVTVW